MSKIWPDVANYELLYDMNDIHLFTLSKKRKISEVSGPANMMNSGLECGEPQFKRPKLNINMIVSSSSFQEPGMIRSLGASLVNKEKDCLEDNCQVRSPTYPCDKRRGYKGVGL